MGWLSRDAVAKGDLDCGDDVAVKARADDTMASRVEIMERLWIRIILFFLGWRL